MKSTLLCRSILLLSVLFTCACATKRDIIYLQDTSNRQEWEVSSSSRIILSAFDKISILVNSKDPSLSALFNLPIAAHRISSGELSNLNSQMQVSLYSISERGEIDFPVIGTIKIAGLTREEAATKIKNLLESHALIKSPIVTIEFANLSFSVMGEVNKPGRQIIDRDRITLLDAIGMAGDLTIFGRRDNIIVLRQEEGVQRVYRVDLRSANQLMSSPAYYIRQNDIIYVEPNSMRTRQSTVNGNTVLSSSFWISLASLGTTIALFLLRK